MGLLDDAMSMLGGQGGNIMDQVKEMASKVGVDALVEKYPEIGKLLQNVDQNTLQNIIGEVTKNGIPNSLDDVKEIIGKFIQK